jgi:acyl dehydratase
MRYSAVRWSTVKATFKAGDFVKVHKTISTQELDAFSSISSDHNPIHKFSSINQRPLVHGAFLNSLVAGVIGSKLPGANTIVVSQNFSFPAKCYANEPIEIHVELVDVRKIMKTSYKCTQNGKIVFEGEAKLMINK